MAAFGWTPRTAAPSTSTRPLSGATRPATIFRNVDLPQPIIPTIDTNSPRSTDSDASASTWRCSRPDPNVLKTPLTSMNAIASDRPQTSFGHPHQAVEHETHDADGENRQQD